MFRVSRWTGAAEWRRKKWIKHQISPGEETETGAAALRVHSTAQGAEEQSRASVQIHIKVTLLLLLWRRQIWFADIWSRPFSAVFLSRVSHGRMQVLDLQRKLLHFCGQVEPPPPQTEGSAGPGRVALLKWCDFFFFFLELCMCVCVCVRGCEWIVPPPGSKQVQYDSCWSRTQTWTLMTWTTWEWIRYEGGRGGGGLVLGKKRGEISTTELL